MSVTPRRSGIKGAMRNVRRFQLDELILRPGTYFNPQTEIMIVVDDSPEVDNEIFEAAEIDATEWVQISDETPLDEHQRDDLIERFQHSQQPGSGLEDDDVLDDEDDELDPDEDDEDDDEEDLDPLEFPAE
ncbi:MAG: hypothetical protein QOK19_2190 [Solirubrobacteraceae bacterium]|nr:hypothetical protein [Solirubrobacteraceae bacterium]